MGSQHNHLRVVGQVAEHLCRAIEALAVQFDATDLGALHRFLWGDPAGAERPKVAGDIDCNDVGRGELRYWNDKRFATSCNSQDRICYCDGDRASSASGERGELMIATVGLQPAGRHPEFPLDIRAHIFAANEDDSLRADATVMFQEHFGGLFDHAPRPWLSPSMAGSCVLEAWAQVHSRLDIPVDPYTQLTRFDAGHLMGLWEACLLAAIIESRYGLVVLLEEAVSYDGLPGHCDLSVYETDAPGADALWVVDFKFTYWSDVITEAKPYQVTQTAIYALARRAPWGTVFTTAPAIWKGDKSHQHDFEPWQMQAEVDDEIARLRQALGDEAPVGDPDEPWRCKLCSFSACAKNKNPRKALLAGLLPSLHETGA